MLEPADGAFDGFQIRQRAAQPAFGDEKLAALFGRLPDRLLRLFFRAHEKHAPAFGDRLLDETAGGVELGEGLAQVNDVDSVPGIEDEFLHLGVPPFGLMTEVDARFQ